MDPITAARELGRTIQLDPRYTRMMDAQKKNDDDKELQELIGAFNLLRVQLNAELQKGEKDSERIKDMDTDIKEKYRLIFENENMKAFSIAREEVQGMVGFINQIITGSVSGEDPDTIEYQASCGGDCGGCSGCS